MEMGVGARVEKWVDEIDGQAGWTGRQLDNWTGRLKKGSTATGRHSNS